MINHYTNGEMLGETTAKPMVALVASDHHLVIDTTEEMLGETKAEAMVALVASAMID